MTKFEFVLNKFYEITVWSLFAAIAMTALNGGDGMVSASMADSSIVIFGSTFLSDLSLGSQHDKKRVCDSHCHSLYDYEWDCAWRRQLVWLV